MRLTGLSALASRQAPNRNPSDDLALVGCSETLGSRSADMIIPPRNRISDSRITVEAPRCPRRVPPEAGAKVEGERLAAARTR